MAKLDNPLDGITRIHSATCFYAVLELHDRLAGQGWAMMDLGGPLDATEALPAGGMTSRRQFPEQLLAQR